MSVLFSPGRIHTLDLPNRVVIPPMCQYSAGDDGLPTEWHLMHYGSLAASGSGLLITEATAVSPEGRITPFDLGLWNDTQAAALEKLLHSIRAWGTIPFMVQLGHAGRKGSRTQPWHGGRPLPEGAWSCVAPSALPFADADPVPVMLDAAGLESVKNDFAAAAIRADAAGFDGIEIHLAHGYLLHQFLSPLANIRDDVYGGSLENRLRFPLEVFAAVRSAFPPGKPVGVRISGSDWVDGGWDMAGSLALCRKLETLGCAFIHVSGGGLSPLQTLDVGPGYQVAMAGEIKRRTTLPVIAVGLITEAEQAESIVRAGDADLVAIGRAMLFNPHWTWQAAARLGAGVDAPPQYWRSAPHGAKGLFDK